MRLLLSFCLGMLALPGLAETPVVPGSRAEIAMSFAPVVKAAAPAVVNIYATRVVQGRASPFAADPFFGEVFRQFGEGAPRVQNALGSGVIVSSDGIVVSNHHVVGDADEIRVVLNDRREYGAEVMLGDEASDLVVLKLRDARDLPTLSLADSDAVEVGDLVLAIGNPFGVGQTVSSGIVSGVARSGIAVGDGRGYFIQTDAGINPGNSGGALVDMAGRLIGINSAILSRGGGSNGIGFAIPANLVRQMVAQAASGETRFRRPWAGLGGQAVDAALAEALGLPRPEGVIVTDLHPASPFRIAGLAVGDVLTGIGGDPVNTLEELAFRLSALGLGTTVDVDWLRDGEARRSEMVLGAAPEDPPRDLRRIAADVALRGLAVARINPAVIEDLGLPASATGVVAFDVADRAARTGLQPGDILLAINGRRIATPEDAERAARDRTRFWQIDLQRGGQVMRLRLRT